MAFPRLRGGFDSYHLLQKKELKKLGEKLVGKLGDVHQNSHEAIKTGEYEQTKSNNIYDLAGNLAEWTTESCNDTLRTLRGSEFGEGGYGVDNRAEEQTSYDGDITGFRLALYL